MYMLRLIHGLGVSQTLAEALLWSGSYTEWRQTAHQASGRLAWKTMCALGRSVLRRRSLTVSLFDASFAFGQFRGFRKITRMRASERKRLLGGATLPETPPVQSS
jgi:hypothetical protein